MSAGAACDSFLAGGWGSSESQGESHLVPCASKKPPLDIRGLFFPLGKTVKRLRVWPGLLGRRLQNLARPSCQTSGGERFQ